MKHPASTDTKHQTSVDAETTADLPARPARDLRAAARMGWGLWPYVPTGGNLASGLPRARSTTTRR